MTPRHGVVPASHKELLEHAAESGERLLLDTKPIWGSTDGCWYKELMNQPFSEEALRQRAEQHLGVQHDMVRLLRSDSVYVSKEIMGELKRLRARAKQAAATFRKTLGQRSQLAGALHQLQIAYARTLGGAKQSLLETEDANYTSLERLVWHLRSSIAGGRDYSWTDCAQVACGLYLSAQGCRAGLVSADPHIPQMLACANLFLMSSGGEAFAQLRRHPVTAYRLTDSSVDTLLAAGEATHRDLKKVFGTQGERVSQRMEYLASGRHN